MSGPPRKRAKASCSKGEEQGQGSHSISLPSGIGIKSIIPLTTLKPYKIFAHIPNNLRQQITLAYVSFTCGLSNLVEGRNQGEDEYCTVTKLAPPILPQSQQSQNSQSSQDSTSSDTTGAVDHLTAVFATTEDDLYTIEKGKCSKLAALCGKHVTDIFAIPQPFGCCWFAVTSSGSLFAWGYNKNGNLGLGHCKSVPSPVQVSNKPESFIPVQIVGSEYFTLAIDNEGSLYSWRGWIECDVLHTAKSKWRLILNDKRIRWISAYGESASAVGTDGVVYEWEVKDSKDEPNMKFEECKVGVGMLSSPPRTLVCKHPIQKCISSKDRKVYLTRNGIVFYSDGQMVKIVRLFDVMDIGGMHDCILAVTSGGTVFELVYDYKEFSLVPKMVRERSMGAAIGRKYSVMQQCLKGWIFSSKEIVVSVENALGVYLSAKKSNIQDVQEAVVTFMGQNPQDFTTDKLRMSNLNRDELAELCSKILRKCSGSGNNSSSCTQEFGYNLILNSQSQSQ